MTRFGRVRHHAVIVSDLDSSGQFYASLGFTQVVASEAPDADFIRMLSGGSWSGVSLIKLANKFDDVLECLCPEFAAPGPLMVPLVWSHFAISVEDCAEAVAIVTTAGGVLVGGPVQDPTAPFRVAYARDPWGNLLELVEPT